MSRKPEYKCSNEIIAEELKNFKAYLEKERYDSNTIRTYSNYTTIFLNWLSEEHISTDGCSYNDVIAFIDHWRKREKSRPHTNRILLSIRHYFTYLSKGKKVKHNPASGIYIRGTTRRIPHDILSKEDLITLYQSYEVTNLRTYRNKVMTGLLIYQGVTTEELHKLKPSHVKLREGKIEIPGSNSSNGRTLKLEAEQVIELHEYIEKIRPQIIKEIKEEKPGRKPDHVKAPEELTQLFISLNGSEAIKNSLKYLVDDLKAINPEIKHARQIRNSVITYWLKEKDIRTVQYMAGHRYISSTERYKASNMEGLQEQLSKHHPLN